MEESLPVRGAGGQDRGEAIRSKTSRRRARPEFQRLGAALRSIRDLQVLFLLLVLASALYTMPQLLLVSDPLRGDEALVEALLGLVLTAGLVLGGARLAFEPLEWSLALALAWSAWTLARLASGAALETDPLGVGLWVSVVRTLPFARLAREHPNSWSVRRVAVLQGRSGARVSAAGAEQAQRQESSRKAWRLGARGAALVLAVGSLLALGARLLRPEDPALLGERFRNTWNQGGAPAVAADFGAEVRGSTDENGRALLATWPALGPLVSAGSPGPHGQGRSLDLEFSLADGSGSVAAVFDWTRDGWRARRIQVLSPCLAPVLDAFVAAWNAGDRERVLALSAAEARLEIAETLENAAEHRGWPEIESRSVHASGSERPGLEADLRFDAIFRGARGELYTSWRFAPAAGWRFAYLHLPPG